MKETHVPKEDYEEMKYKYQQEKDVKDDALRRFGENA